MHQEPGEEDANAVEGHRHGYREDNERSASPYGVEEKAARQDPERDERSE